MSTTMTIRLGEMIKKRLEQLEIASHRTKYFRATDAIEKYKDLNEWKIQEIESAISEADKGDFATDDQVVTLFNKWL